MFSKWSLYTPLSIVIRNGLVSTGSVAHRVHGESLQSCLATHHVHATLHFNGSRLHVHAMLHFNGSRLHVHAMLHFNYSRLRSQLPPWVCPSKRVA